MPDELGVTKAPDCFPTHDDIGDDCDLWERHCHSLARRGRRRHVEFAEPAREGNQGVVVEPLTPEAKYEVIVPGLVNVLEQCCRRSCRRDRTADVGAKGCAGWNHFNSARTVLAHRLLSIVVASCDQVSSVLTILSDQPIERICDQAGMRVEHR